MTEWLSIGVVLIMGSLVSWLSTRLGFPNAVAQTVLGIFLGSAVLGWVPHGMILHTLGEIGVVLLLGAAGLQLGINRLTSTGLAGALVAILGLLLSIGGGFAIGIWYGAPQAESLYVGLALAATSIGVTVQVLTQYGIIGRKVADVIIAAAVLDDIIALYLLGTTHGLLSTQDSATSIVVFLVFSLVVLAGLYLAIREATRRLETWAVFSLPYVRIVWVLVTISLSALLSHSVELSTVVGAFFAGVGIHDGMQSRACLQAQKSLQPLVLIMVPFFFVMIGVQAQWQEVETPAMWNYIIGLCLVAIAAKALSGLLGAFSLPTWRERWAVGLGMVPRGEVGLVVITIGFTQGHVSQPMLVVLVFVTILVTAIGPLLFAPVARYISQHPVPASTQ